MTEGDMNEYFDAINNFFNNIYSNINIAQAQANPIGQLIAIIFMLTITIGLVYIIIKWFAGKRRGK